MTKNKMLNGVSVEMSAEEEAALDAHNAQGAEYINASKVKETEKTNKKASGKQKLKDLGLDDDEIKALTGA